MTSEEIQEARKDAEDAGWIRLPGKGPRCWGWCAYTVMEYKPGQWWGYLDDHRGYNGLGISMKTREEAQAFCEDHYYDRKGQENPRRGEPI